MEPIKLAEPCCVHLLCHIHVDGRLTVMYCLINVMPHYPHLQAKQRHVEDVIEIGLSL